MSFQTTRSFDRRCCSIQPLAIRLELLLTGRWKHGLAAGRGLDCTAWLPDLTALAAAIPDAVVADGCASCADVPEEDPFPPPTVPSHHSPSPRLSISLSLSRFTQSSLDVSSEWENPVALENFFPSLLMSLPMSVAKSLRPYSFAAAWWCSSWDLVGPSMSTSSKAPVGIPDTPALGLSVSSNGTSPPPLLPERFGLTPA
mmetsp:Transcript_19368/g.56653  ORF Transcript_19368/g.56653 Transcript_19368/m.56653 type:complete len:200 (+) Transcript_19368:566-1165(+)